MTSAYSLVTLLILLLVVPDCKCSELTQDNGFITWNERRLHLDTSKPLSTVLSKYLDNAALLDHIKDFTTRCRHIAQSVEIGRSVDGQPIVALEISDKPGRSEPEPNVKIVGNLHGDEPTGRVFTLAFAEWLCQNYKTDPTAKKIVRDIHLWLIPTANPDGFSLKSRSNKNDKDLNRNFPDHFSNPSMTPSGTEEPETKSIMDFTLKTQFVSSLAMHEGALVANYPWDGTLNRTTEYNPCPDDATFKHLATTYATSHRKMTLPSNEEFFQSGGITNGAAWYPIYGSMQDWNYVAGGCMELTLEVSENKWPDEKLLAELFEDNRVAMMQFILTSTFGGLRGKILVESDSLRKNKGKELLPTQASITIQGSDFTVKSKELHGDYYRPLAPGDYTIIIQKKGFNTIREQITVPDNGNGLVRNFVLRPKGDGQKGGGKNENSDRSGGEVSYEQKVHDGVVMVLIGGVVLNGLWLTHRRLSGRFNSFVRNARRL